MAEIQNQAIQLTHYQKYRESMLIASKRRYHQNKESWLERSKQRMKTEEAKEYQKKYREAHKEEQKKYRDERKEYFKKYREEHKDKMKEHQEKYKAKKKEQSKQQTDHITSILQLQDMDALTTTAT